MKTEDTEVLGRQTELNQARSKPDTVDRPVRTAHIFVHHCNSTHYCNTETVFIYIPLLQTNITCQMWPSGGKGDVHKLLVKYKTQLLLIKGQNVQFLPCFKGLNRQVMNAALNS